MDSPPEARTDRVAPRAGRLILAIPLAIVSLALITHGLFWPWLAIRPIDQKPGGIVVAAARFLADSQARHLHRTLCAHLVALAEHRVRCITLPVIGASDSKLASEARAAGATLVVRIGDHGRLHLLATDGKHEPIPTDMPAIAAPQESATQALAYTLLALSQVLAGEVSSDASLQLSMLSSVEPSIVSGRVATLAWALAALLDRDAPVPSRSAALRSTFDEILSACRTDGRAVADWYCALARYANGRHCARCQNARLELEYVVRNGPPSFRDLALLALAEDDCRKRPARAFTTLARLDHSLGEGSCTRLAMVATARCLSGRSGYDPGQNALLRRLRQPDEQIMTCPPAPVGSMLNARAQYNARRGEWSLAERDWHAAWLRTRAHEQLLRWAESRLHQRTSREVVELSVQAMLIPAAFPPSHRLRAAFLDWVAAKDRASADELISLYRAQPTERVTLSDHSDTLSHLACTGAEHGPECRVLHLMLQPRTEGTLSELADVVRSARRAPTER